MVRHGVSLEVQVSNITHYTKNVKIKTVCVDLTYFSGETTILPSRQCPLLGEGNRNDYVRNKTMTVEEPARPCLEGDIEGTKPLYTRCLF